MQRAQAQQQSDKLTFGGQAAALQTEQRNQALGIRQGQRSDLNSWNQVLQQQKFQSKESAKERQFTAKQNKLNRAPAPQKGLSGSQLKNWASKYVKGKQGGDKKISPSAYYAGFSNFYTKTGLGQDEYMAIMSKYVNTSHAQDYRLF